MYWTLPKLLETLDWEMDFLRMWIPDPLRPEGYSGGWDAARLEELIISGNMRFPESAVRLFWRSLGREVYRNHEILQILRSQNIALQNVYAKVRELNAFFHHFGESMTLKEIAAELGYRSVGTLRNNLTPLPAKNGRPTALLELPGLSLRLYKSKNQWRVNRLDFMNQVRGLGVNKLLDYFRGKNDIK